MAVCAKFVVLLIAESQCSWKAACILMCHSGAIRLAVVDRAPLLAKLQTPVCREKLLEHDRGDIAEPGSVRRVVADTGVVDLDLYAADLSA